MIQVEILTLFPAMFTALTEHGVSGRAVDRSLLKLGTVNPRDYTSDRHRTVDDKPYGGGPGMVMMVEPLAKALAAAVARFEAPEQTLPGPSATAPPAKPHVVYLSPQGAPLTQRRVEQLATLDSLVLICGRYEGIDERFIERHVDEEISVGDFVVSGGELPAMLLLDALIRQLPGALGSEESAQQDSFNASGLLDHPHYTRPESVDESTVPEVLLSGDHRRIASWRLQQSLQRTLSRRPDLIDPERLPAEALSLLAKLQSESEQS